MNDQPRQTKHSKRQDLQGIRGIAIIAVLGFHFYPKTFPNGYLGVDQFFVLSGFLMCMLLKRSPNTPICSLITLFYSKRFKRILPLYFLIISISLICLYLIFPETAVENNQISASRALLFASNRPKSDEENYFQQLAIGIDIFTHTWSLSVEVQFYFLVPLIYIVGDRFSPRSRYFYYSLVAIISFIFYSISNANASFNSVFARIWQFIIGMVVYMASENRDSLKTTDQSYRLLENDPDRNNKEEEEDALENLLQKQEEEAIEIEESQEEKEDETKSSYKFLIIKYCCLVFLLCILCYPNTLPNLARPIVTILTGFLIFTSADDGILSFRGLTYFGDISYSLYLIHWPIYSYWKLVLDNNQTELLAALFISVFLASLVFETFEKWYLKISSSAIALLVVALFILNVILINKNAFQHSTVISKNDRLDGLTDNMTMDDAIRLNAYWTGNDNKNLMNPTCHYIDSNGPLGWCNNTGLEKSGKYKIAVFGNSWTANHGRLVYQECHHQASILLQGAAYGCEVFYPSDHSQRCADNVKDFEKHIAELEPDYGFAIARFFTTGEPFSVNATSLDDDEIYQFMKKQLNKYIVHIKKKLFILSPLPVVFAARIGNIVPEIRSGKPLAVIDKEFVDSKNYDIAMRRFTQLYKDCGEKCVPIDYSTVFYNQTTSTFRFYDERGFSFFTGINHLSPRGLEQVRSVYTDICKNL